MSKKSDIEEKRNDIVNYYRTLLAVLCFKKMIDESLKGYFYFGGALTYRYQNNQNEQTPDIIVDLSDSIAIGEVKKSLPFRDVPIGDGESKKLIEVDTLKHLKKYDKPFKECRTDKHDLMLFAPERDNEALNFIADFLDEKEKNGHRFFDSNFAIIVYVIEEGRNRSQLIRLKLNIGTLTNSNALGILRRGYQQSTRGLTELLGRYKIYEEANNTPPIYVMGLLWTSIFSDLGKKSEFDKIIEWHKRSENSFEVSEDNLLTYLHRMYTLPSYNNGNRRQFNRKIVLRAMECFGKIVALDKKTNTKRPLVKKVERDGQTYYRVWYKRIPKDETEYFLKHIYKDKEAVTPSVEDEAQQRLFQWT